MTVRKNCIETPPDRSPNVPQKQTNPMAAPVFLLNRNLIGESRRSSPSTYSPDVARGEKDCIFNPDLLLCERHSTSFLAHAASCWVARGRAAMRSVGLSLAFALVAASSAMATVGDTWILGIDHIDNAGFFETFTGAGYSGPQSSG